LQIVNLDLLLLGSKAMCLAFIGVISILLLTFLGLFIHARLQLNKLQKETKQLKDQQLKMNTAYVNPDSTPYNDYHVHQIPKPSHYQNV
jgi:hypothetical protein